MKRLALAASLVLAIIGGGCDDDGDSPAADGGRDTAPETGGGGGVAMCTGTFATYNRTTLGNATSASGACKAAADLNVICTADINTKARACGTSCLMLHPATAQAALLSCVDVCLQSSAMVSPACGGCYRDLLACTLAQCSVECTTDPNSAACRTCQTTKGCMGAFFTCSGLPGGSAPDAGADTNRDTGDTGGDVLRDTAPDGGTDARDGGDAAGDSGDARPDGADGGDAADATAG